MSGVEQTAGELVLETGICNVAGGREYTLQGLQPCVVACSKNLLPSACSSRDRREREQPAQGTESLRQVCELECSWQGVRSDQPWCWVWTALA